MCYENLQHWKLVNGENVKTQPGQVFLIISEGLELVYKVIKTVLVGYLVRKLTKKVMAKSGMDFGTTI